VGRGEGVKSEEGGGSSFPVSLLSLPVSVPGENTSGSISLKKKTSASAPCAEQKREREKKN